MKEKRESSDIRLGDSLLGLPCLQRRRAELVGHPREGNGMNMVKCPLCGMEVPELMYELHEATDRLVIQRMQAKFPGWEPKDGVCEPCLERFRSMER